MLRHRTTVHQSPLRKPFDRAQVHRPYGRNKSAWPRSLLVIEETRSLEDVQSVGSIQEVTQMAKRSFR